MGHETPQNRPILGGVATICEGLDRRGWLAALLRIAYIDAGTLRSTFKEFDLSETMTSLVEDFAPIAQNRHRRVITGSFNPENQHLQVSAARQQGWFRGAKSLRPRCGFPD